MFIRNKQQLLYKTIIKSIWRYGIQLWGGSSTPNLNLLEMFQSKILRSIVEALWFVPNSEIRNYLGMKIIREEIKNAKKYKNKLSDYPNQNAEALLEKGVDAIRVKRRRSK